MGETHSVVVNSNSPRLQRLLRLVNRQAPYAPRVLIAAARRAELTHALQMPLTTLSTALSKPKAHTDSWIDIAVLEKAEG